MRTALLITAATLLLAGCFSGGGGGGGLPQADLEATPSSGVAPLVVNFDASLSGSPGGAIVSYAWDFDGDDTVDRTTTNPRVSETYTTAGTFQATVTVEDDAGNTDEATVTISVLSGDWRLFHLDVVGNTGQYTSAAVINNRPAIAYSDASQQRPRFTVSFNAAGTSWGTPLTIDSVRGAPFMSLAEIDGRPAAAWHNAASDQVMFAIADDAAGQFWGEAVEVGPAAEISDLRLFEMAGDPAVVFVDRSVVSDGDPVFIPALDVDGTAWGGGVLVDEVGEHVTAADAAVVNGFPGVAYVTAGRLRFVQAQDAFGDDWFLPETAVNSGVGNDISLAVVNGFPAISFLDTGGANADLGFVIATDPDGTSWDAAVEVDGSVNSSGQFNSLAVVGGRPAIAYYNFDAQRLQYVTATNTSGSTWDTFEIVDATASVGQFASLVDISGIPGISYYDATDGDLKWAVLE